MVVYVLWYHLTVSSVTVGLNPFLSFALTSLCELPNRVLDTIVVRTTPRRIAAASAFTITAGAMSVYYIFSNGTPYPRGPTYDLVCGKPTVNSNAVQRLK